VIPCGRVTGPTAERRLSEAQALSIRSMMGTDSSRSESWAIACIQACV
jgi:hypothetical protein